MNQDAVDISAWLTSHDEAAFARLVGRYHALVIAACRRELDAGDNADAAAQAVFIILARRIGGIRDTDRLAPWLFGVAMRVCQQARRSATRRQRHEHEASMRHRQPTTVAGSRWDDVRPLLNEALLSLSQAQREVVIGHCLQGQTQVVVAAQLGISDEAVKKRFHYALAKLRIWFARRGVAMGSVALAAGLAAEAGASEAVASQACISTAMHPSGSALRLAVATLKAGAVKSAWMAAATILVCLACAVGILSSGRSPAPPLAAAAESQPPPPKPAPAGPPAYYLVQTFIDDAGTDGVIDGRTGVFTPNPVDPRAPKPYTGITAEILYGPGGRWVNKAYEDGRLDMITGSDGTQNWQYDPRYDIIVFQQPCEDHEDHRDMIDARTMLGSMTKTFQAGRTMPGKEFGQSIVSFGDYRPEIVAKREQKPRSEPGMQVSSRFGSLAKGFELLVDTRRNLVLIESMRRLGDDVISQRLSIPPQEPGPAAFLHTGHVGPLTIVLPDPGKSYHRVEIGTKHVRAEAGFPERDVMWRLRATFPCNMVLESGVGIETPVLPGWAEGTKRLLMTQFPKAGVVSIAGDEVILLCKQDGAMHRAWNAPLPDLPSTCARRIPNLVSAIEFDRELDEIEVERRWQFFLRECPNQPLSTRAMIYGFDSQRRDKPATVLDAVQELSAKSGVPIACDAGLGKAPLDITLYHPLTVRDGIRVIAALVGAHITSDGKTVTLTPGPTGLAF